jgi:RND family efflux transporter MFP subunit
LRQNRIPRNLALIAPLLIAAGCSAPDGAREAPDGPRRVRVADARAVSAVDTVPATGTVRLRREISLGFTTPGRIANVNVNEGDRVAAGTVLAALDSTDVAASLASANAELGRARAELARTRELFARGWVTKSRLDNADAAARAAAAAAASAGFAARTARIVAPTAGLVLRRLAEPNQVVAAGTPVISFGDERSGYVVRVPVADRDAARLSVGTSATVTVAALGDKRLAARVAEVAGRADDTTGTFEIELALPSVEGLKSGQVVSIDIDMPNADATRHVVVPVSALFAARAGEAFVYVVGPDSKIAARRIVPGKITDAGVDVVDGLRPGERVVTTGINELVPGMTISAVAGGA